MIGFMNLSMMDVWNLPAWPPHPDLIFWVALTLVAAALLGELVWRVAGLPRVLGYGAMGVVLSAFGAKLGANVGELGGIYRQLVDLALAVLLFELGSRVSLTWLRANLMLLLTSMLESGLTLLALYFLLLFFGFEADAALAGAVVMGVSAGALLGRVSQETRSNGQVTERMLVLAALNTLYGVLLLELLISSTHVGRGDWLRGLARPIYVFAVSGVAAALLARAVGAVLRRFELREENPALLVLGLLLLGLAVSRMFALSTLLVPLLAGVLLRNGSPRPCVWPRHFGTAGGVLVLLLFVVVGASWSTRSLLAVGALAAALLLLRLLVKGVVLIVMARLAHSSFRQGAALALTLAPVSATMLVLLAELRMNLPDLALQIAPLVTASISLMALFGPLLIWAGLSLAKERAA
jgi:Kef-type K+ transport system membrane component KefB